MQIMIDQA